MIKGYLIFLTLLYSVGIYAYNQPSPPPTAAQMQQKAKDRQKERICLKHRKHKKFDRMCDRS